MKILQEKDFELLQDLPDEIKAIKIQRLKELLKNSDYQAIKFAEGQITEEEYAPIRVKRQEWRDEINALQE